jgi:hypothetical protein
MPTCHACGRAFEVRERVGFRDTCDGCAADLHVCLNCEFHDPPSHNQCRETQADPIVEKDRANRCEWFRATRTGGAGKAGRTQEDARAKLDALFKKKET